MSRITGTWINLMFHSFKAIEHYPPWHVVEKHMPDAFKKEYPNTYLIIDTTEFQVERPSSLLTQSCTFPFYKNRNTVKVLIGIIPSGVIAYVSSTYEGSISDKNWWKFTEFWKSWSVETILWLKRGFRFKIC